MTDSSSSHEKQCSMCLTLMGHESHGSTQGAGQSSCPCCPPIVRQPGMCCIGCRPQRRTKGQRRPGKPHPAGRVVPDVQTAG